jgi:ATPase subunit of ABC transporter with duplicated ATPase domains
MPPGQESLACSLSEGLTARVPRPFPPSQDFMNTVCTHIVHLKDKKLTYYTGNYDQFVQTRADIEEDQMKRFQWEQDQIKQMKVRHTHPERRSLIGRAPLTPACLVPPCHCQEYIARFGHGSAKLARQAQSKEKTLAKMVRSGLTERVTKERVLDFRFPDPGSLPPPVLQVRAPGAACHATTFVPVLLLRVFWENGSWLTIVLAVMSV